jgi:hypothetical protein
MTEQVNTTEVAVIEVASLATTTIVVEQQHQSPAFKNLYVCVRTIDNNDAVIGYRIVDLYHPGTSLWKSKHNWWAMHNGHAVHECPATEEEIAEYHEEARAALASKFNRRAA